MRIALPVFALCLLAGFASPQSTPLFEVSSRGAQALAGISSFGRVEGGQLTDDGYVDAVFLAGGSLHVGMSLEAWDAVQDLGVAATDFAVVPGSAPSGLDAVVFSDSSGLHWMWFEPTIGDFASEPFAAAGTANALRIRAADLNGDGAMDLSVLSSDGLSIYEFDDVATLPPPSVRSLVGGIAKDLVLADLGGLGTLDSVVLQDAAISMVDSSGALVLMSAIPGTTKGIAVFADQSGIADRVAVVTTSNAVDSLHLVGALLPSETVVLPTGAVTHVAAADLNRDGEEDLILSHGLTHELLVLYNKPGGAAPSFEVSPNSSSWLPLVADDPSTATNEVKLPQFPGAVGFVHAFDVDHDGDLELLGGVETSPALTLLKTADVVNQLNMKPVYSGSVVARIVQFLRRVGIPAGYYYFASFDRGPEFLPSWTHVEVISRERRDFANAPSAGSSVLARDLFPIRFNNPSGTEIYIYHEAGRRSTYDYPYVVRFIELDGSGALVSAGPCLAMSFAPDPNVANLVSGTGQSTLVVRYEDFMLGGIQASPGVTGSGDTPVEPPTCIEDPLPTDDGGAGPPPPSGT